jgi:hypothetical protein
MGCRIESEGGERQKVGETNPMFTPGHVVDTVLCATDRSNRQTSARLYIVLICTSSSANEEGQLNCIFVNHY